MTSRDFKRLRRIASGAEVASIFWYFTDRKLHRAGFIRRYYTGDYNKERLGITEAGRQALKGGSE
ncbi:hypothetical protein [Brucella haematophila]|uniref:Uncharacterized protein n=1 Tax=Brucella haematophila TaxID=419474 RepID=A0ABX1DNC6_9HYPH|nr:hypothetical protein [Brucella haematophila]NKC04468.1 hypothetical protein [Brucella haematophila]TMV03832.1 hypothetical protein FGI60_07580 [Brucella haematophila]